MHRAKFIRTKYHAMKTTYFFLVGLAFLLTATAQTNLVPTQSAEAATNAAIQDTNAATLPAPTVAAAPVSDTNAPVATAESTTNAPAPAPVGIPQIRFSDVPITTAIENLARLANINYMIDPKIGYGLPDANGQIKVEPTLSIRWENITAENALLALLDNYNLQFIHDKRTGIDRITMKDPTAPPPLFTKVVQLKYASALKMIDAAQSVLTDKRSKVLTDIRTSQLVVVATDPEQQAVETLINQLDRPTRQVLIETRLIQVSSNPKTKKGVDWSGTLQGQHVNFGNGTVAGSWTTKFPGTSKTFTDGAGSTVTLPSGNDQSGSLVNTINPAGSGGGLSWNSKSGMTPNMGFLNADGLSAVLSFFNSSSEAQIMSTPRIVTIDNETARISVSRGYPVFSVQAGTQNTAGGSQVSYTNVGTILEVTPRISANDYIWLRVIPEVSSYFGDYKGPTVSGSSLTAPQFDIRRIETQVMIPNANTLVLGGLVQDSPRADYTKVPLLGDVPGLGYLFRSESKEMSKDNLLIFITPTIVKDSDFQLSNSGDFLKSRADTLKQSLDPKTAWDSSMTKGKWNDPVTETTK